MANIKISALPTASAIADANIIPIVQSGVTKTTTVDLLLDAAEARTNNTFGEGYHEPATLTNGFAQDATTPLKVVIAGFNNNAVYFRGLLDCSLVTFTPGVFIQAFRLPTNCRPVVTSYFPVIGLYEAIGLCAIHTDGYVYLRNLTGELLDSGIIDFANIHYYRDPF